MLERTRSKALQILRWSEKYTRTDMVYLATSGFWLNINYVFISIFSFLLSIAFASLLPKSEYGTYQYILSVSSILVAFTFTGFNSAIIQSVARGFEGELRASIRPQLLWNIVPTAAALAWSGYYFVLGQATLGFGILLVAISLPIINTFNSYLAYLAGKQDFKHYSLYQIAGNAAYYVCIFFCIFLVPRALPLIFVNLLVTTGASVYFYFRTLRTFRPQGEVDVEALPYARHLSLMNVLNTIAGQIDNILVFHFLGAADLAVYSIASLLPEKVGSALQSLTAPAFPRFAGRNINDIKKNLARRLLLFSAVILVSTVLYILCAPLIFHLIYPAYTVAIPFSQLYTFTLVNYIGSFALSVLSAHRKIRQLYTFNIVVPVAQIAMQVASIILWGLWGLVFAKVASSLIAVIVSIALVYAGPTGADEPRAIVGA